MWASTRVFGVLLAVLLCSANGLDCSFSTNTLYDYQVALDCSKMFLYNETIASHTVTNVLKAMQLYAFRDIAKSPPAPFQPPVNLDTQLPALLNQTFASDFEFQEAVRAIFLQLHDAHTNYYSPSPMRFTYWLPINVFSYVDQSSGLLTLEVANTTNFPGWEDLVGAKVLMIEGTNAVEYVKDFSTQHVGISKDPQTRFNIALYQRPPFSMYNGWDGALTWRPHHFSLVPSAPTMEFQLALANGTTSTVSLPWKATSLKNYSSTMAFEADYYNSNGQVVVDQKKEKKEVNLADRVARYVRQKRQEMKKAKRSTVQTLYTSTIDGLGFYQLDQSTLVWYQNTFAPANYFYYYKTVVDSLLYAEFNGLTNLIMDFSMNGGGDICLGRSMLQVLFPKVINYADTDMPATPLAVNLTKTAIRFNISENEWSPDFYANGVTKERYANDDLSWLLPGVQKTRGGVTGTYSQLVEIAADGCGESRVHFSEPLFSPQNMVFVSRGFCGSTCALFADSLADYSDVKTVVFGGYDQTLGVAYRSFPGLQVLETAGGFYEILDQLYQDTANQRLADSLAPRRLLTTAGFRLCIREAYRDANHSSAPLEYVQQNADYHFQFSREMATNPYEIWQFVKTKVLQQ